MLDPLSAFAVGCNVVQIIEVGARVLAGAAEYKSAVNGILTEHQEFKLVSHTVQNLSNSLESSLSTASNSRQLFPHEARLRDANSEVLRLSEDFLSLLDKLKVKNRNATLESLQIAVKARWCKDKIHAIQKAVSEARNNLNLAFLFYMNAQQQLSSKEMSENMAHITHKAEEHILGAVHFSSESIRSEIYDLAEELKETYLESNERSISAFMDCHQSSLDQVLTQLKSIVASQERSEAKDAETRDFKTRQRVLDSLMFEQMNERWDQVNHAFAKTYHWILNGSNEDWRPWDCFATWLQSRQSDKRPYWIQGKAGSGKSTLMKFLDKAIIESEHLHPWADGYPVLKAKCFFWNPGNTIQKSVEGLYRSLLYQLLDQCPNLIENVVPPNIWRSLKVSKPRLTIWTVSELRNTLDKLVSHLQTTAKVLLLIDGVDEFEGTDEERDDLNDYLLSLASFENVKLCISSRPWTRFLDTFRKCPQLRLEDLTREDINLYVNSRLNSSEQWRLLEEKDPSEADIVKKCILDKASGVFLWVCLIVRDLLRDLRNGDVENVSDLKQKLEDAPVDLDDYFLNMFQQIAPQHREEASTLLQLALHTETKFNAFQRLRLIDVLFINHDFDNFATAQSYNFKDLDFNDESKMRGLLDRALRRLNSRAMGLLECLYEVEASNTIDGQQSPRASDRVIRRKGGLIDNSAQSRPSTAALQELLNVKVDFIHKSARDFLKRDHVQKRILFPQSSSRRLNARLFLCNSRLVQFKALVQAGVNQRTALGIASYLFSALSVDDQNSNFLNIVPSMQPAIKALTQSYSDKRERTWNLYVEPSLNSWEDERSTFLTLTIDFKLKSYVLNNLSVEAIRCKKGRPILDYVLRPRFGFAPSTHIGKYWPDTELLYAALNLGANPNQIYRDDDDDDKSNAVNGAQSQDLPSGPSVWALFLCYLADTFSIQNDLAKSFVSGRSMNGDGQEREAAFFDALQALVRSGAESTLPQSWLSTLTDFESYPSKTWMPSEDEPSDERFHRRWPSALPIQLVDDEVPEDSIYAVSDLLEGLKHLRGLEIDSVVKDLRKREPRHTKLNSSVRHNSEQMETELKRFVMSEY